MEDFPARIADFLEQAAARVRSLTVDRLAAWMKWAALGLLLLTLFVLSMIFLLIGLFRLLGEAIGVRAGYAAVGGLFVLVGAFLWSRRKRRPSQSEDST